MAILARVTLREILDKDPHHPIAKAIEAWINDKLQRRVEDVFDAWISARDFEDIKSTRHTPVYTEINISVTFKDGFEAQEILYVR